jgi:hypothetical protein
MVDIAQARAEIEELARVVIELFGSRAAEFATERADELEHQGESDAAALWHIVRAEIERLQNFESDTEASACAKYGGYCTYSGLSIMRARA